MLVVLAVGDEQPRLVEARGPAEELLRVPGVDSPPRRHLAVQRERGPGDPLPLRGVDPVPLDPALHGGVTDVLVADAADEIEQEPFAKGHLGDFEVRDAKCVEGRRQHRHPARKHGTAVVPQLPEPERIDVPGSHQLAPQAAQRVPIDPVPAPAGRAYDGRDRLDRARGADRGAPAGIAVLPFDGLELDARREHRALHRLLVDPAFGKEPPAGAHAAHVQALPVHGGEAAADDAFGAAAADVDDEAPSAVAGQRVGDAEVDEPGLLAARDDLDGMAEHPLRLAAERLAVAGAAQRIGADRAHRVPGHAAQPLSETAKTGECALDGVAAQPLAVVEPGRQAHRLAQAVHDVEVAAGEPADDQMEAVRAEIDRGEVFGDRGRRRRWLRRRRRR